MLFQMGRGFIHFRAFEALAWL